MKFSDYCILVAEDDSILRYITTRSLRRIGYRIIEAANGRKAMLRAAEQNGTVHVLVTNVRMPEMDGHELARELKKSLPHLKVLIVSAVQEMDFPPDARAHDFALLKPVRPESVVSEVARLLQIDGL
jgi:two-component system, cell cycle sensor histidine kinase and response regulator CckA